MDEKEWEKDQARRQAVVQDEIRFRCEMEEFMRGEWTLEMPTKPGAYPVCALGTPAGFFTIVVYERPCLTGSVLTPTQPWGGWWWSEPLPHMPNPPDCGGEVD